MSDSLTVSENRSFCRYEKGCLCTNESKSLAQITLFIVSFISLTIAVFFTLVSSGVLYKTYPLYLLGEVAPFMSGLLLTLSSIATALAVALLAQKPADSPKPMHFSPEKQISPDKKDEIPTSLPRDLNLQNKKEKQTEVLTNQKKDSIDADEADFEFV